MEDSVSMKNIKKDCTLGVLLTRGQVFTNGHYGLVEQILEENDYACIVVGSADKCNTKRNPFTIDFRLEFIEDVLTDFGDERARVFIFPLTDWISESNKTELFMWGHYFYYNVVSHTGFKTFKFYYSDGETILDTWFDDEVKPYIEYVCNNRSNMFDGVSATQVRELLLEERYDDATELIPAKEWPYIRRMSHILRTVYNETQ